MYTREATRADLPLIADVASRSMMNDEFSLWLSPNQKQFPHVHRERCLRSTIRRWNTGHVLLVVCLEPGDDGWVDGEGERIVAYAAYEKEVGAGDDSKIVARKRAGVLENLLYNLEQTYIYYFRHNLNTLVSRYAHLEQVLAAAKYMDAYPKFYELSILVVDPEFGRRGIGTDLVKWGQRRAREDGVPLLLWASVMGRPLYRRLGFKEIDRLIFDEKDDVTAPVMVWRAEGEAEAEKGAEKL